ncbi:MAG: lysophospholipid acyltransferase family protein [Desulfobulbia bacterium]
MVTIICWLWFLLGGILFFLWRYVACALFVKEPEASFQRLNSRFYRVFFYLLCVTAPRHKWVIDQEVAAIRSAVIVCNHLSYLDPLLLIALFARHRTIVKTRFFKMPIWGWIIRKSGYFPAAGEDRFTGMMLEQMESMAGFLRDGGNLFVFPEGTRSRDGQLGALNRGALKIARLCKAPVYVLQLAQTDKLFPPGRFLFQTRVKNTITLKIIDRIEPDYEHDSPSTAMLEQRLRDAYSVRVP